MFVQDFIDVPVSGERVLDHVANRPWLAPLACTAAAGAATDSMSLVPGQAGYLEVGEPRPRGDAVVVPLRWDIEAAPGVVLSMSADLEVVPTGTQRTQLALCASYARPFGHSATDRSLQRAAAHIVRELLLAMAATLTRGVAAGAPR